MKLKKKLFNKSQKAILFVSGLMTTLSASAQEIFGSGGNKLLQEVRSNWGWVLLIVTIIFLLFNLGNFMGENSDSKKGVRNILLYVGAVLLSIALIKYLETNGTI